MRMKRPGLGSCVVRAALPSIEAAAIVRIALAVLFVVLVSARTSPTRAAESPLVYHSLLTDHGDPGIATLATGTQTLELYLEIGTVATNTVQQTICVDGEGDEVCGFTLGLKASGGISIVEFCPNGVCAPGLVHHLDTTSGLLRINRLGPAIDQVQTPFYVGRLTLQVGTTAGDLSVASESQAVSARLNVLPIRDDGPIAISLPEPATAVGLFAGVTLLIGSLRRRPRRCSPARAGRSPTSGSLLSVVLVLSAAAAEDAWAGSFSDPVLFWNVVGASGSPPERLGFEAVPLSGAGFAALGQNVRLGPLALRSLSLAADVDLAYQPGVPLGLLGTLLVADPTRSGDPALHPGGTAQGNGSRGDDDLRIRFDVPMFAAGLRILGNVTAAGEKVDFLDASGQVIASSPLPGGGSPPGADGFVGYVLEPGDAPIQTIRIDEAALDGDDIAVDELLFSGSADSFADAVAVFSPTVVGGEPVAANLDPSKSLGAPNLQAVSLGRGGIIIVRFVDNVLSGSGDALPDLRLAEVDPDLEGSAISVSANGSTFVPVGTVAGGTQSIDLDAYGLGQGDELLFVRIVDDVAQGPTAGPAVGADIDAVEALSGTWRPPDADGDRVADEYDDCPTDFDAAQRDDDADGVGNVCDDCRHVANPGQQDADADGEGNACERARIRLVRDFQPVPLDGKARLGSLLLDCGGADLRSIVVGIWVPPGPAAFDFGGNCRAPSAAFAPPGAPTGPGCTGPGIAIGPTVEGAQSGAFGMPLGDPLPPSFRSDVVFVSLRGALSNGGKLCSAFQTNVLLGRIRATTPLGLSPGSVVSISLEDQVQRGWCAAQETSGACSDQSNVAYRMESALPPVAELRLQPASGATSTAAVDWDVCIADTTVSYMHRVTLGLLGPVGADYPTLFLDDCLVGPTANGKRTCAGQVGSDPEWVDETVTFTQGPLATAPGDLLAETLYTPIEGGAPGTGGADVLNPYLSRDACVGIVTNQAPPATPGAPPILVRDGFFDLAYHDAATAMGPQPYQTADSVLEALDGASVYESIVFNSGDDLDGDGFTDPVDDCPFLANADQRDDGGFATTVPNGLGNACECGDANGSGRVMPASSLELGANGTPLTPDLQLIREYLVGLHADDPAIALRCSVHGDPGCDAVDAVVLDRALQGLAANPVPRCDAAVD